MKARVIKSTGSWYLVLKEDGKVAEARIRGKLRLNDKRVTNPVTVGDWVKLDVDETDNIISEIFQRENYIARKAVKKSSDAHLIASNIDQAVLVVTVVSPSTSNGFIDRFLVSAESFRIPQVILFNKSDILQEKDKKIQGELIDLYSGIGIKCLEISAKEGINMDQTRKFFKGKTTLISGHSGVGKSTLLNSLYDELDLKTSGISSFANKGVHTTTFAEMHIPERDTFVIDTPGIKELGLFDMNENELADYFPEMRDIRTNCKFNNCLHMNEPGCAIKIGIKTGIISEKRYKSYCSMILNEDNRN